MKTRIFTTVFAVSFLLLQTLATANDKENSPANNPLQVTTQWAVNIGPTNTVQTVSPALNITNDVVYFPNGNDGKLYAINTNNGSKLWEFDYIMTGANAGGRGSVIVGPDGTIYFPATQAGSPTNYARLFAVNPDGTLKWEYKIGEGANITYVSPAITTNGDILVGNNGTDGALHLVDKNNGTRKAYAKPAGGIIGAIVVSQDNIAYGLTGNWGLVAYDMNNINTSTLAPASKGVYRVQNEGGGHFTSGSPAIDGDGNVIAAFNEKDKDDAAIVALNGSSANISHTSFVWEYLFAPSPTTSSKIEQFGASIGADGTVYVGGHDTKRIYALNPNGSIKWIYDVEETIANSPAIDNRGYLHFGGWNGNYFILKDNGTDAELLYKEKLSYEGEQSSQIWSSLAIADDGSVYISAQVIKDDVTSSRLYKMSVDGTTGAANSYWPMKGGNAQRTGLQVENISTSANNLINTNNGFEVFSNNNKITVKTPSKGEVVIYDLFGRIVLKEALDKGTHTLNFPASPQMYIVKWENISTKVLLR